MQEPLITFESPGVTVKGFCAVLSEKSGQKIAARDQLQDDRLAVRLENAPLSTVLAKLCWVERGRLEQKPGGTDLWPDQNVWLTLRTTLRENRIKQLKASVDRVIGLLAEGPLTDQKAKALAEKFTALRKRSDQWERAASMQARDAQFQFPLGQALIRALAAIPIEELSAIQPGDYGVWSTQPTAVEHNLGLPSSAILSQLRQDQRVWLDAARNYLPRDLLSRERRSSDWNSDDLALIRLEVYGARNGRATVGFSAYGQSGAEIASMVVNLQPPAAFKFLAQGNVQPVPSAKWMPIAKLSREFCNAWSYSNPGSITDSAQDPAFVEAIFNPEKSDPVDLTAGAEVLNCGAALNQQVIAQEDLAEVRFLVANTIKDVNQNVGETVATLLRPFDPNSPLLDASSADGWLLVRSPDPDRDALKDFDRADLGAFMRAVREKGTVTLDDVGDLAASSDDYFGPYWAPALACLPILVPDMKGADLLTADCWAIKSFYGRLSVQQRLLATQGGLRLQACSSSALTALRKGLMFSRLAVEGTAKTLTTDWITNPSDGIPNGLPGGGVFFLTTSRSDVLQVTIGDGSETRDEYFTPETLARRLHKKPGDEIMNSYDLSSVRQMSGFKHTFRFEFPGGLYASFVLDDYSPVGPAVKKIDDLPPSLRQEIESEITKLESGR